MISNINDFIDNISEFIKTYPNDAEILASEEILIKLKKERKYGATEVDFWRANGVYMYRVIK